MARYRKKPVIVEAEQWFPERHEEIEGVFYDSCPIPSSCGYFLSNGIEGKRKAGLGERILIQAGDWIVTNSNGRRSVCRPKEFEETHELVED